MVRIAAIAGSLSARSTNHALLRAAQRAVPDGVELAVFDRLADVPALDPALDVDGGPPAVRELRSLVGGADGVLIASPEYGHSMPGTLKNALDWLVGSGELAGRPVALMSASTTDGGGIRAQMALTQTLLAQAAHVAVALTVPGVKAKLDERGELADERFVRRVRETLRALAEAAEERRAWRAG